MFSEPAYVPPVSRPDRTDRKALRAASKLLDEAGWTLRDGMRRNAAGEALEVELLDDSPAFERIINPYVENLRRAGIDARYSLIDAAQMQQRQEDFDYDVIPGRLVMSLTPGEELAATFGTRGAGTPGTLNLAGVAHPGVDALIVEIAKAKTREKLNVAVRALAPGRCCARCTSWVPNWYKAAHNVAYWDVFGRPAVKPPLFPRRARTVVARPGEIRAAQGRRRTVNVWPCTFRASPHGGDDRRGRYRRGCAERRGNLLAHTGRPGSGRSTPPCGRD